VLEVKKGKVLGKVKGSERRGERKKGRKEEKQVGENIPQPARPFTSTYIYRCSPRVRIHIE